MIELIPLGNSRLAAYTALVHALSVKALVHRPSCISEKHKHDLPREIDFQRRHDEALRRVMDPELPLSYGWNCAGMKWFRHNDSGQQGLREGRSATTWIVSRSAVIPAQSPPVRGR
jgi:hypothetical protein